MSSWQLFAENFVCMLLYLEPTETKNFVRPDIAEICLKKPRFKYTTFMKDLALCMLLTV